MPSRSSDARRALLVGAFAYLTINAGLSLALATGLAWMRSADYEYKKTALVKHIGNDATHRPLTVVVFGSSRVFQGLRSDYSEEATTRVLGRPVVVYNFGVAGAGPFSQLFYLRRLLADGVRPDLVILEVLPAVLGDAGAPFDIAENRIPIESLRLDELPLIRRYADNTRTVRDLDWWLSWTYPAYSHRFAIVSHTTPILLNYGDRRNGFRHLGATGWMPMDMNVYTPERRRECIELAKAGYAENLKQFQPGKYPLMAVRESLELCREHGVRSALILMPEGPEFRSWYPASTRAKIDGILTAWKRAYDVPLLDANTWLDSEEHFVDSHHMTPEGAALFSRLLGERTLPSLLRR